jgi:hypothetical protein
MPSWVYVNAVQFVTVSTIADMGRVASSLVQLAVSPLHSYAVPLCSLLAPPLLPSRLKLSSIEDHFPFLSCSLKRSNSGVGPQV